MDFSILHDPLKRIISDFFDAVAKKYDIELGLILKTFEELQFKKNICSKCGIKGVYNYEDNDYGVRCIKCKDGSMVNLHTKKYTERRFRKKIEELGGKVMGKYKGNNIPVDCICPEGHSCNPRPSKIQQGRGMCIVCACRDPVTAEKNFRICIEEIGGKVMGEYKGAHIPVDCICPEGHSCNPMPGNIQRGRGMCIRCSLKGYSNVSIKWLNIISIENDIEIIHAINEGEHTIANSRFRADGYCKETNTIYEFDGCYWHGHECKYHPEKINSVSKKTFGELYEKTLKRHIFITQQGYNLVQIWECDFNAGKSYSKIVSAFSDKEIRIDEVDVIDDEILEFDEDLNDIFGTFDDTHYCV